MKASATSHTVTVEFDDGKVTLERIIESLNESGYSVGDPEKL